MDQKSDLLKCELLVNQKQTIHLIPKGVDVTSVMAYQFDVKKLLAVWYVFENENGKKLRNLLDQSTCLVCGLILNRGLQCTVNQKWIRDAANQSI